MKQLFKIQNALKNKNKKSLLASIEKDKKKYNALKKEYISLRDKKRLSSVNNQFIVYFFLNAVTHGDLEFAYILKNYHKIDDIDSIGTKIALGRFYHNTNFHKKAVDYYLPIFKDSSKKLDFYDTHRLFISCFEMAMFKDCEAILKYALDAFPDIRLWKYEALKYQILTSHIYPEQKKHIVNNLNYMVKQVVDVSDTLYMASSFYNAGYYQQSFNMFDKYFTMVTTDVTVDIKKHLFKSQNTLDSMNEIIDLLEEIDTISFPIGGSLLGLVRDGKLFDHDKDADIGIFVDSYEEVYKIVSHLCKLDKFSAPSIVRNPKEFSMWNVAIFDMERNAAVDLFFFYKKENHYEQGLYTKCAVLKWVFQPFELKKEILAGKEYYVPEDYENWLTQLFGNWKETVVVWESLINCPNITKDSQVAVIYYALQKLTKAIEERSLKKFDNIYKSVSTKWNFKFSKEADDNLKKIREELKKLSGE